MSQPAEPAPAIVAFDVDRHDRESFRSGTTQVDNFFRKTANKLAKANNLRMFVMETASGQVIGFYAINAHSIDYEELPPKFARTRPAHGKIPAVFISMIGVDERFQGQGFGSDLLVDCLSTIVDTAARIGIAGAMLDILDCGDPTAVEKRKNLYFSFGFRPTTSDPLRLFLPLASIQALVRTS